MYAESTRSATLAPAFMRRGAVTECATARKIAVPVPRTVHADAALLARRAHASSRHAQGESVEAMAVVEYAECAQNSNNGVLTGSVFVKRTARVRPAAETGAAGVAAPALRPRNSALGFSAFVCQIVHCKSVVLMVAGAFADVPNTMSAKSISVFTRRGVATECATALRTACRAPRTAFAAAATSAKPVIVSSLHVKGRSAVRTGAAGSAASVASAGTFAMTEFACASRIAAGGPAARMGAVVSVGRAPSPVSAITTIRRPTVWAESVSRAMATRIARLQ